MGRQQQLKLRVIGNKPARFAIIPEAEKGFSEGSMYAIIDFGGKQYKVEKGDEVIIDRVSVEEGKTMTLTPVLLGGNKKAVTASELKGAKVKAKVEEHILGDKIVIFNYKPKKGSHRKKGHRSRLSRISIQTITAGKKKTEAKTEKKADAKTEKKAEAGAAKKDEAGTAKKAEAKPAIKAAKGSKKTVKKAEK